MAAFSLYGITAHAQVTLTTSPYTQNFNGVGTGLPTGWTVRTGATATALGTAATFVTTQTAWSSTTGQFDNVSSTNGATSADSAATQNANTDRAVAIRQTGTVGDPGAVFALQITNTTGLTSFSLSFKMIEVDPSATAGRTTTWNVDYGFGTTPTTFTNATTSPATVTTVQGNGWGATTVTVNFGNALDNQSGNVWIRVATKAATSGAGTRPHSGIDDVSLSFTSGAGTTNFYSKSTGNLDSTATWGTNTDGTGTAPTDFTTAAQVFNIRNNATPTIGANWTVSGSGSKIITGDGTNACNFTIPSNFSVTGTVDVSAAATLTNQNTANPTFGTLNATSTVDYNGTGAQTVAAVNYGNLTISGARAGTPAITLASGTIGVSGTFSVTETGAVTYVNTGNTVNFSSASAQTIPAINYLNITNTGNGNRTLASTGTVGIAGSLTTGSGTYTTTGSTVNFNGSVAQTIPVLSYNNLTYSGSNTGTVTGSATITIGGNLSVSAGTLSANSTTTQRTVNITGDFIQSGGTFDGGSANVTGNVASIVNLSGNFNKTSGTITTSASTSGFTLNFSKTGTQTFSNSGTFNFANLVVNSSSTLTALTDLPNANGSLIVTGTLDMDTFQVTNLFSSSTVAVNGTLKTKKANGLTDATTSSAISSTNTTVSLGAASTIEYSATTGTQTITGRSDYANLTISGGSAKTLGAAATAAGTLTLTSGIVTTTATNLLTLGSASTVSGASSSSYVSGPLARAWANNTAASRPFPIGKNGNYRPLTVNMTAVAGTSTVTAEQNDPGTFPGSSPNVTNFANRYWTVTESGSTSRTYSITLDGTDFTPSGTAVILKYNNPTTTKLAASFSSPNYTASGLTSFSDFGLGDDAGTPTPLVSVSTNSLTNFGTVAVGSTSSEQSYNVSGTNLTANITVTAPTDFEVSLTSGSGFGSSVTVTQSGGTAASTPIFVHFIPGSTGAKSGNITNASSGATTQNVAVSGTGIAAEPTTQASAVQFSSVGSSSMTVSWTNGNGSNRIVLMKQGGAVDSNPVDGTSYTANTAFTSGTQIGTGNYVVFNGTGNSVTVTNLSSATTYFVAVYEFNGSGGTENYLTTAPATGSQATTAATYTWIATSGSASWTTTTSWSPTRTTPATTDILQFSNGGSSTATAVPTETEAKILVSGNTTILLNAGAANTLTVSGGSNALSVASGSALNVSTSTALIINLPTGSTGSVSGTMNFAGGAHRLTAADASAITFQNASTFTAGASFSGSAFGTTNLNSVVFANGSTYVQLAGSNPFGAGAPNSVVVFQTGSLFSIQANLGPSFSGRTYANLEINSAAFSQSGSGGNALVIDNLTVTAGSLSLGMTGTPGHAIKGNISVASGATLNFNAATAGTLNLSGTAAQTISGAGTLAITTSTQTIAVTNANGVSLQKNISDAGAITVSGVLDLGTSVVSGTGGTVTVNNGGTLKVGSTSASGAIIGNVTATGGTTLISGSTVEFNGAGAQFAAARSFSNLTINNSNGVTLLGNVTVNGISGDTNRTLTLTSGNVTTSTNTLIVASGGSVSRTSGHVIGNLQRTFAAASNLTFDVGTTSYSPVSVNATAGTFPADFTVKANAGQPAFISSANALQRYWTLTGSGITADLTFTYPSGDASGTPANYRFFKNSGGTTTILSPTGTPTSTTASISGVTSFSDWGLGELNTNANLSNLTVSSGALSPAFDANTLSYTAPGVSNATTAVNVTPTLADVGASVTVNGSAATSGSPTSVSLSVGNNAIPVVVTAQDGNTTKTYTINIIRRASQTINFSAISTKTYGDAAFDPGATATSGLSVSYSSSNTSVATVSGHTITIVGAGTSTITASQAGDSNYDPAPNVQQTLTVNRKAATVTPDSGQFKIKGASDPTFTYGTTGLVSGDSLTGSLSRAAGENAGSYAITQGTITNGNNPNYDITFTTGVTFVVAGPFAAGDTATRQAGSAGFKILKSSLLTNDYRVATNGSTATDSLSLTAVQNGSGNTVSMSGSFIFYTPSDPNDSTSKQFTYTLHDAVTGADDTGTVTVQTVAAQPFSLDIIEIGTATYDSGSNSTSITIGFVSVPGQTVFVEYSHDMTNWFPATDDTHTDGKWPTGGGSFQVTVKQTGDHTSEWASAFFRGTRQ